MTPLTQVIIFSQYFTVPHSLCTSVSVESDVPESEFPDYVRLMHEDRDHRLELEYKVCLLPD